MKIEKKISINKSASDVWTVFGREFNDAYKWMSVVYHSYENTDQEKVGDAPFAGRTCELSTRENGLQAEERITLLDDKNYRLNFRFTPQNAPAILPVNYNDVEVRIIPVDEDKCEVVWTSNFNLKSAASIMTPLLKVGLGKGFVEILEELKYYMETGKPHPRKIKKARKAGLAA